jgi:predicted DNA-binding WGR domain protein
MARISSAILATEACRRDRERIVTRMGEDRLRASFAPANRAARRRRIAQRRSHGKLHRIESITRNRFVNVVGPESRIARISAMNAQPYQLYVERRDSTKNMARFYSMSIDADLFGELCLTRRWGRIGARGQTMIHHFEREQDAVALFLDLIRQKRARGYRTMSSATRESDRAAPSTEIVLGKIR